MPIATVFRVLDAITLLASILTALRLWKFGLARRYPVLTAYLLYMAPYLAGPVVLNLRSVAYYRFWMVSEPLLWIIEILLVRELCGAVLERYRGIRTLGRWTMYASMVISVGFSILALRAHLDSALSNRSPTLALVTGMERGVTLALAIFLLLMLFLVSRYPMHLSRNVMLITVVFTTFFLTTTLGAILRTVFDRRLGLKADVVLAALATVCVIAWMVLLTPAGEEVEGHWLHFSPHHEARLLRQLASLNRSLSDEP